MEKRFLSIEDLGSLPKPCWAIEGLFEVGSLTMLFGPPKNYKSFLALDWILSMATGRKWNHRSTCPGKVLYVLGEGKASLLKRINAWTTHNRLTPDELARLNENFRVDFTPAQLASKASIDNMLAQLSAENFCPSIIVIDTLARAAVGLDENNQKDAGIWVDGADRLRQLGMTVLFLHHTGKNTEFGFKFRGSSALEGAIDTSFLFHKDPRSGLIKLTCTNQKDHDEGRPIYFKPLGINGDEDSIVLLLTQQIDEGFTDEGRKIEEALAKLIADDTFMSDRARARRLSEIFPNLTESASQNRIVQIRKKQDKQVVIN